jgi:amidophosphoribosyltransferase
MPRHAVYAGRDAHGLRPLCLGELEGGHVIASESCALATIGARFLREVEPGEIVRLDRDGLTSLAGRPAAWGALPPMGARSARVVARGLLVGRHRDGITSVIGRPSERRALCIFEYVYFARPDSLLGGQVIHKVRQAMGRQLAREAPADADVVVPVPDSAVPAAIGYGHESGLQFIEGLTKNRYIGRTFIQPDDHLRKIGIQLKFNPLTANLQGKRVVLIDDSIVRGNTARPLVQLLRDGGASEVHVRVSSPPVRHPCFMGVDMATYKELIANRLDVEGIRQQIGADSLDYLSLPGLESAVAEGLGEQKGHCTACFSGKYPIKIPSWLTSEHREKLIFEDVWGS